MAILQSGTSVASSRCVSVCVCVGVVGGKRNEPLKAKPDLRRTTPYLTDRGHLHDHTPHIKSPHTSQIVDRLKNLIKLKGGEYIAIEAMESTYANSVFVNGRNGGLMCYGRVRVRVRVRI